MKRLIQSAFVVGFSFILAGCGAGRSDLALMQTDESIQTEAKVKVESIEYIIQPNDRLAVTIYKYPELTPTSLNEKGTLVDSKGYISLPLIHRVKVAGYSQTSAARTIEKKYANFLTDPSLYLEVVNKRVYVLGEVNKQGPVTLDNEYMTVLQAITSAGGLTDAALRDEVYIVSHDSEKNMHMRKVDMTSFSALQASNLTVKPNDIIYVQPNSFKQFRVASNDYLLPLDTITRLAQPFVTLKYLFD
jgi:polysaccharide biosynthesis/export protein